MLPALSAKAAANRGVDIDRRQYLQPVASTSLSPAGKSTRSRSSLWRASSTSATNCPLRWMLRVVS
jgi:hypothetical protein